MTTTNDIMKFYDIRIVVVDEDGKKHIKVMTVPSNFENDEQAIMESIRKKMPNTEIIDVYRVDVDGRPYYEKRELYVPTEEQKSSQNKRCRKLS